MLDAAGRATSEAYGNGLWLQSAFDPLTGQITSRRSGTGGSETNVQQLAYGWDEAGNLETRQDLNQGLTETFGYDALERLTSATGPGGTLTVVYDAIGNITSRSDVGSYTYHATKKHAVIGAGGNTYSYDANGNLKNRNGKSLTWRSYNLPSLINGVGYSASFSYTPDRRRWRQVSGYASGNETTIYVGGQLEKLSTPVRKHWKRRIATPAAALPTLETPLCCLDSATVWQSHRLMKSRLAETAKRELLADMRRMSAEERLAAFLEHCQWAARLNLSARLERRAQAARGPRSAD